MPEENILNAINAYRNSLSLKSLKYNQTISKYAEQHCQNMADGKVPFSHDGMNERFANIKNDGVIFIVGSENVAKSKPAFDPVPAWKKSQGHDKNLRGNWTDVGIGEVKDKNGFFYYCAIFIRV